LATWDFEDTRDHYLERVFGLQPAPLRRSHVAHYLAASRALMAHIMSTTLARWRSPASATHGALVFTAGDLQAGAGWGLIDVWGEPKSAYYGFQQVAQPLALLLTNQGCDGLDVHVVNDTPQAWTGCLAVQLLRQGKVPIAKGEIHIEVPAYAGRTWSATQVLGAFYDVTYAYRFGAPGHDTVVASLLPLQAQKVQDAPQEPMLLLQACYFPLGIYAQPTELGIKATLTSADGQWWLLIESATTARFVHIDDRTHRAQDQYFHLPAGVQKRVRLMPRGDQAKHPQGVVTALNGLDSAHYSSHDSAHSSGRAHPC
jgi:beta-mannosidase